MQFYSCRACHQFKRGLRYCFKNIWVDWERIKNVKIFLFVPKEVWTITNRVIIFVCRSKSMAKGISRHTKQIHDFQQWCHWTIVGRVIFFVCRSKILTIRTVNVFWSTSRKVVVIVWWSMVVVAWMQLIIRNFIENIGKKFFYLVGGGIIIFVCRSKSMKRKGKSSQKVEENWGRLTTRTVNVFWSTSQKLKKFKEVEKAHFDVSIKVGRNFIDKIVNLILYLIIILKSCLLKLIIFIEL